MTTRPPRPALAAAYGESTFDPLVPRDLLSDEIAQRWETGYDVDGVVERANRLDPDDRTAVLELVDEMATLERRRDWPYVEPDGLAEIRAVLPPRPAPVRLSAAAVRDRIHAGWLGRIAGCNVGKPLEEGRHWTSARIRSYLELAGAYPLDDYVPVLDPMPAGFQLRENWPQTTRGNVDGSARDDDIDYAIVALHLLETHGGSLDPAQVGQAWMSLFPLRQVYTAERAAYVNLVNGLAPPEVATFRNPYREWIGAQIRGDVFGYVHPGDPRAAAELAHSDASLSHVGNGVYGEMWSAALVSAAFGATSARDAVTISLSVLPPRSRLSEAVAAVLGWHRDGLAWDVALGRIQHRYGHYAWVHTINNAAVVTAGLLWGDGDVGRVVGLTVMGGWDTDSNGATAGSVAGVLGGTRGLPDRLVVPLRDRTRSAVFGFDQSRISDLAERTYRLAAGGLRNA